MTPSLMVTGGAGFIGANFVHYWLSRNPSATVVVLDALTYAGNKDNLAPVSNRPGFTFVHGDIGDEGLVEELLAQHRIDTLVNFAAESHVDRSIEGPDAFIETNIVGTHALLKVARRSWLQGTRRNKPHRFHHVSTDEVYGALGPGDPPFTEESLYAPNSPYAASKAASDHLVRAYHHTYGLRVTTSNCSNNYGPYQFPEKLIPLMIMNALEGRPMPVYGDGSNIRDWIHVHDHCVGLEAVLKRGTVGQTYNIGGGNEWCNRDIVSLICRHIDTAFAKAPSLREKFPAAPAARGRSTEELIAFVEDRPGHDWRYAIDGSKMKRQLGFTPAVEFNQGLAETVQWMIGNHTWWKPVSGGQHTIASSAAEVSK